jgi:hypothetical protein
VPCAEPAGSHARRGPRTHSAAERPDEWMEHGIRIAGRRYLARPQPGQAVAACSDGTARVPNNPHSDGPVVRQLQPNCSGRLRHIPAGDAPHV